ncbi:hypothetical protein, partial [Bacillus altitudinis]|uniref:hypothetical protein n=1 Tax=Bacillus altitudinis TaxID=293387 RepID=UPI001C92DE0E
MIGLLKVLMMFHIDWVILIILNLKFRVFVLLKVVKESLRDERNRERSKRKVVRNEVMFLDMNEV